MQEARLVRTSSGDHGTMGVLLLPGRDDPLHVIEPPWRDNRRNRSCIPGGRYEVLPHRSPRFGRCLLVAAVPDRSHILFHAGNVAGDVDKGLRTHSQGCLLPGLRRGRLDAGRGLQRAVLASRTAFRHLMDWAGGNPFSLEVSDANGLLS